MTNRNFRAARRPRGPYLEQLEDRWVPVMPAYSSLPGAPVTLYLDFDGHYQATWGSYRNLRTQAFDSNGNAAGLSGAEMSAVREIWLRVAEDFAPFNLNVTTVEPGPAAAARSLRVVIGATAGFPAGVGGVAYVDSFLNSAPNVVYVLADRLGNVPRTVGSAAAHEAGHAFGLRHQSRYDSAGRRIEEYHSGDRLRAPIMGHAYDAQRNVWWYGPNDRSASSIQDDMAVLARSANGFGYRADDHGDSYRGDTPLWGSGTSFRVAGLVSRTTDQDWFSFSTSGGTASLALQVAEYGSNLDAVLELYRDTGGTPQRVASAAPGNYLGASLSTWLREGTYYVVVRSQGVYGDVGTYTLTGNMPGGNLLASPPRSSSGQGTFSSWPNTGNGGQSSPARALAGDVEDHEHEEHDARPSLDRAALNVLMGGRSTRVPFQMAQHILPTVGRREIGAPPLHLREGEAPAEPRGAWLSVVAAEESVSALSDCLASEPYSVLSTEYSELSEPRRGGRG